MADEFNEGPDGASSAGDADWVLLEADEQARKLPATYTNRLYAKHEGSMLRIAFGEQVGEEIVYRTCMIVPNTIAIEMGQLLTRMGSESVELNVNAWRAWVAADAAAAKPNG